MLYEATMALLTLMFLMWAAAIWGTYRDEGKGTHSSSTLKENYPRSAA